MWLTFLGLHLLSFFFFIYLPLFSVSVTPFSLCFTLLPLSLLYILSFFILSLSDILLSVFFNLSLYTSLFSIYSFTVYLSSLFILSLSFSFLFILSLCLSVSFLLIPSLRLSLFSIYPFYSTVCSLSFSLPLFESVFSSVSKRGHEKVSKTVAVN